jgi:hypothetical protein
MTDERNGSDPEDEDEPLEEADEAAGTAVASEEADESLDERVEAVLEELDGVGRRRDGQVDVFDVGGRVFAVLGPDLLEVVLEGSIARAALTTPDTRPSPRGAGWVAFTPKAIDRFALDRAEAWVRFAHRRAGGGD